MNEHFAVIFLSASSELWAWKSKMHFWVKSSCLPNFCFSCCNSQRPNSLESGALNSHQLGIYFFLLWLIFRMTTFKFCLCECNEERNLFPLQRNHYSKTPPALGLAWKKAQTSVACWEWPPASGLSVHCCLSVWLSLHKGSQFTLACNFCRGLDCNLYVHIFP